MVEVFISQPMRGKPAADIVAERDGAFLRIAEMYASEGEDVHEVPSYFGERAEQMQPLELLGKSIELLAHADVAVFCPGWREARGCRVEHLCAELYGIEVVELL